MQVIIAYSKSLGIYVKKGKGLPAEASAQAGEKGKERIGKVD